MISEDYGAQKYASRTLPFLEPGEDLLLAGMVQWVQLAKFMKMDRNLSEGFLCVTSDRILHIVELGEQRPGRGVPSPWGNVAPTLAIAIQRNGIGKGWSSWVPRPMIRKLQFAYAPAASQWDERLTAFERHVESSEQAEVTFYAAKGFCRRVIREIRGHAS